MKNLVFWFFCLVPVVLSAQSFDVQGHRGCRGVWPENTVRAFQEAMEMGVTTLELDVVISGDGLVVVSHEPWISGTICQGPDGEELAENKSLNIYHMTYAAIQKYDCGGKGNPAFPSQNRELASKPLLSEVLEAMEEGARSLGRTPLRYNIELKSKINTDHQFHPAPAEFSQRVYDVINEYVAWDRITIQSFDFRVLKHWHERYPEVALAALSARPLSARKLKRKLGFTPEIYSPYFKLLSANTIERYQEAGMRVIPWTINEVTDMQAMMDLGVDGIITDYPNRLINLLSE